MSKLVGVHIGRRYSLTTCIELLAIAFAFFGVLIVLGSENHNLIKKKIYLCLSDAQIEVAVQTVKYLGYVVHSLLAILSVLLVVAFFTLFERKLLSSIQRRRGPNVAGFWGALQPIADGVKLLIKEFIKPRRASAMFFIAPVLVFFVALNVWAFTPVTSLDSFVNVETSLYFIMGFSSLSVYGVMGAGWASGSRYALLGGLRAVAQLISYEIALGMLFVPIILMSGSASVARIVEFQLDSGMWNCIPWCGLFMMFMVIMLAETNRTPFDLPEAEAELVAGFNVEYSSGSFALFFLAEYASMFLMSVLAALIFLGGYGSADSLVLIFIKSALFSTFIVLIRGVLPRYRYDQLMSVHWRQFLLFVFAATAFGAAMVLINESTPLAADIVEATILQQFSDYGYGFSSLLQALLIHPLGTELTILFDYLDLHSDELNTDQQVEFLTQSIDKTMTSCNKPQNFGLLHSPIGKRGNWNIKSLFVADGAIKKRRKIWRPSRKPIIKEVFEGYCADNSNDYLWHRNGGYRKPTKKKPGLMVTRRGVEIPVDFFEYWNTFGRNTRIENWLQPWSPGHPAPGIQEVAFAKLAARIDIDSPAKGSYKLMLALSLYDSEVPLHITAAPVSKRIFFGIQGTSHYVAIGDILKYGFFDKYGDNKLPQTDPLHGWVSLLLRDERRSDSIGGPRRWMLDRGEVYTLLKGRKFAGYKNNRFKNEANYYSWLLSNVDKVFPDAALTEKEYLKKSLRLLRASSRRVARVARNMYFFKQDAIFKKNKRIPSWSIFIVEYLNSLRYKVRFFSSLPVRLMPYFSREALYYSKFFFNRPGLAFAANFSPKYRYMIPLWVHEYVSPRWKLDISALTPASIARLLHSMQFAHQLKKWTFFFGNGIARMNLIRGLHRLYSSYFFIAWLEERIYCQKAWRLMTALQLHVRHTHAFTIHFEEFEKMSLKRKWYKWPVYDKPRMLRKYRIAKTSLIEEYTRIRWYREQIQQYSTKELLNNYDIQTKRSFRRVLNMFDEKRLGAKTDAFKLKPFIIEFTTRTAMLEKEAKDAADVIALAEAEKLAIDAPKPTLREKLEVLTEKLVDLTPILREKLEVLKEKLIVGLTPMWAKKSRFEEIPTGPYFKRTFSEYAAEKWTNFKAGIMRVITPNWFQKKPPIQYKKSKPKSLLKIPVPETTPVPSVPFFTRLKRLIEFAFDQLRSKTKKIVEKPTESFISSITSRMKNTLQKFNEYWYPKKPNKDDFLAAFNNLPNKPKDPENLRKSFLNFELTEFLLNDKVSPEIEDTFVEESVGIETTAVAEDKSLILVTALPNSSDLINIDDKPVDGSNITQNPVEINPVISDLNQPEILNNSITSSPMDVPTEASTIMNAILSPYSSYRVPANFSTAELDEATEALKRTYRNVGSLNDNDRSDS